MTKPIIITEEEFNQRVVARKGRTPRFDSRGDSALDELEEFKLGESMADDPEELEENEQDLPVADRHSGRRELAELSPSEDQTPDESIRQPD